MNLYFRLPTLLALLFIGGNAVAQQSIERRMTPEQFNAAGLGKLTRDELANLDRWLNQEQAGPAAAGQGATAITAPPHDAFVGASDQPVRSRLRGDVQEWSPGTVFELENGQRWRVLKGQMTLKRPLQSPEIEVAPGLMGRWFLQVGEDAPRARVERIQ